MRKTAACLMSFVIASMVCVAVHASEAEALPRLPLAYFEVDLDANDIVFDPVSGALFASVGGAGGTYANSVVPIDPATGELGEAIPVGLEPNKLALSDNGQYLYVGVDGESSVARVSIPLHVVDLRWHLGSGNPACGPWSAADMVVLGGLPTSVAVSRRNRGCSLSEGIVIYDEAIPRPIATERTGPTFIEGSADDASRLYGLDSPGSPRRASVMAIDSSGITELQLPSPNLQVPNGDFVYDGGMLFDGLHVLDAASLTQVGTFAAPSGATWLSRIVPDTAGGVAYVLNQHRPGTSDSDTVLRVFDTSTFLQIREFDLFQALGPTSNSQVGRFIGIGPDRFAVVTGTSILLFDISPFQGAAGEYTALTPERVLDTRTGVGTGGAIGPVGPGGTLDVPIAGLAGVPSAGVDSVVLNATVGAPSERSYLTVWPTGGPRPEISNLNWAPGETRANLVTVLLGDGGKLSLFNERGTAHVIFDVVGYYASSDGNLGSRFKALPPQRVFDTRHGVGGVPARPVGAGETLRFDVTGTGGIPNGGVTAVALNVTAVDATANSYVTVWPDDAAQPNASNINFAAGTTVPNLVIMRVPASGTIDFYNFDGNVHLLADVVGYYTSDRSGEGGRFVSFWPNRFVDTRVDSPFDPPGDLWPGDTLYFAGEDESYAAYVLNVTVTQTFGAGYLSVHPWPGEAPDSSSLNYTHDVSVPNAVIVRTGPGIAFTNYTGFTHLIADVFGAFTKG